MTVSTWFLAGLVCDRLEQAVGDVQLAAQLLGDAGQAVVLKRADALAQAAGKFEQGEQVDGGLAMRGAGVDVQGVQAERVGVVGHPVSPIRV